MGGGVGGWGGRRRGSSCVPSRGGAFEPAPMTLLDVAGALVRLPDVRVQALGGRGALVALNELRLRLNDVEAVATKCTRETRRLNEALAILAQVDDGGVRCSSCSTAS